MTAARRGRAGPLALTAALLAGCAAPGTDLEALPFYREDRTTPGIVRVDVPAALLSYDAFEADAVAPVVSYVVPDGKPPPDEDFSILRFPWPFGSWVRDGERRFYMLTAFFGAEGFGSPGPVGRRLSTESAVRAQPLAVGAADAARGGIGSLPLTFFHTRVDHDDIPDVPTTDEDVDTGILPLFATGGGSGDKHDYLAIAPFGGTTRGILGKDKITWYGFPYPVYARVEDRAYTSHHVLWPLINWLEGPNNRGLRILPFYAHYERTGFRGDPIYERTWLMWPLLTWQKEQYPGEAPTRTFFAFPFYGHIRGPTVDSVSVLFPFFRYEERKFPETWELRAPFPFVQIGGGPGRFKADFWPLFGWKHRPGFDRQFAIWPLFRREALDYDRARFDGLWALPLFWSTRWQYHETGLEQRRVRVFPLLHYRALPGGTVDVAALSPWWWDDVGFERTIGSFLRLYRYHRDPDGGVEHQALLGLFSWRDLPPLERVDRPAYWRLSLLFGMFHLRSLGGERGLRLFWLPELTWGERGHVSPGLAGRGSP